MKKIFCFLVVLLNVYGAWAQFSVTVNKATGALTEIADPSDQYRMNWIFASGDSHLTWQKAEQDWGLGRYDIKDAGVENERWITPSTQNISADRSALLYKTKYLNVRVKREPVGKDYVETYIFTNTTGKKITISGLDIFTPFNDNYPNAKTAGTNRCNAHVWPGMHSSYVNALRMNGEGPHLGLVLTKGAIQTYSIENRDRHTDVPWTYTASNVRGVIVLNVEPFTLQPNASYTVQWRLFWHRGWDDFYAKAKVSGFVKLAADRYVVSKGEKLTIDIDANAAAGIKSKSVTLTGNIPGEHAYKLSYGSGKKNTYLNYYVISSPGNLVNKRVHFIVDKQQMNDPGDPRYGAYMVYDNEGDSIFTNINLSVAKSDKDEGRERVGMGVLIARWLQNHQDEKVKASLLRYVKFVREKLQTPDYKVFSTVDHKSKHRAYNYPWVAHLYLETYKLTGDKKYLEDMSGTYQKYFQLIGHKHYSIGYRVTDALAALDGAGMQAQKDSLLSHYKTMADFFTETGINYPSHEVNYEQSIVAPAVTFLCEMYQVTKEQKYLDAAKLQLRSLEAFNGRQPDVHLYEIALRHWDGYWFGKSEMWGDTMPHYWSALTALAFQKYYECTGDTAYRGRAKRIVENNLLNFKEDGRAGCAYLYPAFVNDKPAKFYDAFANDQDWALYFYLQILK